MQTHSKSTLPAKPIICGTTSKPSAGTVSSPSVTLTILGHCWSMKNNRSPNGRGGTFKNPKALRFEQDFALQVPPGAKLGFGSRQELLMATVTVYYPSWRQDGDFSLIYDLLQKTGVVSNDRWIRQRHEYAEVDARNPRVELTVELI